MSMDDVSTSKSPPSSASNPWLDVLSTTPVRIGAVLTAISTLTTLIKTSYKGFYEAKWETAVAILVLLASVSYYYWQVRRRAVKAVSLNTRVFVGPRPLTSRDRFLGRDVEIDSIIEKLVSEQLRYLLIFGETGCGKSSLIQAGLIPALDKFDHFHCIYLRFFDDPVSEVREAIRHSVSAFKVNKEPSNTEQNTHAKSLTSVAEQPKLSLVEELRWAREQIGKTIILFIDQFEEIHVNAVSEDDYRCIQELVWHVAGKDADVDAKIVFGMRYDFIHQMDMFEDDTHIDNIFARRSSRVRVEPFDERTARIVIQTLLQSEEGLIWSQELISAIMRDLAIDRLVNGIKKKIVLPTELQIVCQIVQSQNIHAVSEYRGKLQIIRDYIEDAVITAPANPSLTRNVLLCMTDENGTTKAKPQTLNQIAHKVQTADLRRLQRLLGYLHEERHLIHTKVTGQEHHEATFELSHDHLVRIIREIAGATLSGTGRSRAVLRTSRIQRSLDSKYRIPILDCLWLYNYPPDEMRLEDRQHLRRSVKDFILRDFGLFLAAVAVLVSIRTYTGHFTYDRGTIVVCYGLPTLQPLLGNREIRLMTGLSRFDIPDGVDRHSIMDKCENEAWYPIFLGSLISRFDPQEILRSELINSARASLQSMRFDYELADGNSAKAIHLLTALSPGDPEAASSLHERLRNIYLHYVSRCPNQSPEPSCKKALNLLSLLSRHTRQLKRPETINGIATEFRTELRRVDVDSWAYDASIVVLLGLGAVDDDVRTSLSAAFENMLTSANTPGDFEWKRVAHIVDLLTINAERFPVFELLSKKSRTFAIEKLLSAFHAETNLPFDDRQKIVDTLVKLGLPNDSFINWIHREASDHSISNERRLLSLKALLSLDLKPQIQEIDFLKSLLSKGLVLMQSVSQFDESKFKIGKIYHNEPILENAYSAIGLIAMESSVPWHTLSDSGLRVVLLSLFKEFSARSVDFYATRYAALVQAARRAGVSTKELREALPSAMSQRDASDALLGILRSGSLSFTDEGLAEPSLLSQNPFDDLSSLRKAVLENVIDYNIDICRWGEVAYYFDIIESGINNRYTKQQCDSRFFAQRLFFEDGGYSDFKLATTRIIEIFDDQTFAQSSSAHESLIDMMIYLVKVRLRHQRNSQPSLPALSDVEALRGNLETSLKNTRSLSMQFAFARMLRGTEDALNEAVPLPWLRPQH